MLLVITVGPTKLRLAHNKMGPLVLALRCEYWWNAGHSSSIMLASCKTRSNFPFESQQDPECDNQGGGHDVPSTSTGCTKLS